MAGDEQDSTPAPRRRRRAIRRAGPPTPPEAAPAADPPPADPGPASTTPAEPGDPASVAPSQGHTHVPGPGHGSHHPGRDSPPQPPGTTTEPPRRHVRSAREDAAERSLRSLVTTRSSQVSPVAAMRAREVALPTDADIEAADAEVTIVRRHYVPPTALTTGRRPDRPRRRPGDSNSGQ